MYLIMSACFGQLLQLHLKIDKEHSVKTKEECKLYKEVKMNKPGPNAAMTNVGQVILILSKRTYQRFGNPHFCATVVTVPNVHSILSSAVGE